MFYCRCLGAQGSFWGTSPISRCPVEEGEHLKPFSLKFFPNDSSYRAPTFFSFPSLTLLTLWRLDLVILEVFSNLDDSVILWLQRGLAKTAVLQIDDVLWKVPPMPCLVAAVHAPSADSMISTSVWQRQLWKGLSAQSGSYWTPCLKASLLLC